ncbi:MAG: hypothetical protein GYA51_14290 [Candidatus Methanofastidiosa archaeon]|nr:hypothetical protein [Candidatus Methanofastidiosa archaeon]
MNLNTHDKGVIDSISNPFIHDSWIEQNYGFTHKRQGQIEILFGQSIEEIFANQPENDNRYVAFVAIRWGFACLLNEKLTPTEKWINRHSYDSHGHPVIKSIT